MTELQACLRLNVTLKGCYALSYGLLSAAELRDGNPLRAYGLRLQPDMDRRAFLTLLEIGGCIIK